MRRIALTVRADAVEAVLDELLPLLPQGVHPAEAADGVELAIYGSDLPPRAELEALAGDALIAAAEQDAPADPAERRRRFGHTWEVGGRLAIRAPDASPSQSGLPELVIDAPAGAFGTGAHLTTRMCLEILLDIEPAGGFADLGCGAGVLAIAAAKMGFAPVFAIDHEIRSVEATVRNAERNGVALQALQLDLLTVDPPPAPTIAANVPPDVHRRVAAHLAPEVGRVIVSGVTDEDLDDVLAAYARAGLEPVDERGAAWRTLLLERRRD
ncbi:MAG TPA: 50S ribosomal protein L11 methyltransferase [Solirubrobacteraceae bacterium]|nr:50S ribosomal protein L11 methyltransferase [Solirubrobacteraceae bacterium]